jgi:hypothetical protein
LTRGALFSSPASWLIRRLEERRRMRQRCRPPSGGVRGRSTSIRCAPADNAPEDQLDLARPSTEDARVSPMRVSPITRRAAQDDRLASICRRLPRVLPKAAAPLVVASERPCDNAGPPGPRPQSPIAVICCNLDFFSQSPVTDLPIDREKGWSSDIPLSLHLLAVSRPKRARPTLVKCPGMPAPFNLLCFPRHIAVGE